MRAIILDGDQKSALATARSLGEKNISFVVGAERKTAMSFYSRYTKETFTYTSPLESKETFVDELIAQAERMGDKPVIYAFSDATFLSIVRHRVRIERVATLVLGSSEGIEIAFNKKKTLELGEELGIPTPTAYKVTDLDTADASTLADSLFYAHGLS